jgi:hypothetical protein
MSPATARVFVENTWVRGTSGLQCWLEDGDVVVLDQRDRDAFGAASFGDQQLPEGVPWNEFPVAYGGVEGGPAGRQVQSSIVCGVDDLSGQVDQIVVASPRAGYDGDHSVGLE